MTNKDFFDAIEKQNCPFCGNPLEYYEGMLGYEALACEDCGVTVDHNGVHLEDKRGAA